MSEHRAALAWKRETPDFKYESYDRTHELRFGGGASLQASSAPQYLGRAEFPNPEELLAASASSCHFLTFLAIAAKSRFVVDEYRDEAVAILEKNAAGKEAVTRILLRPSVRFGGDNLPAPEKIRQMHERAHELCFIANSLTSEILVEPQP
ncbi:OsmC family peroxiredoxin [Deltaproteobacteria bacterium PRO3]|nr:OsmC family peroxiredoxin [Deltaproteobacteria bacterium PRO3]